MYFIVVFYIPTTAFVVPRSSVYHWRYDKRLSTTPSSIAPGTSVRGLSRSVPPLHTTRYVCRRETPEKNCPTTFPSNSSPSSSWPTPTSSLDARRGRPGLSLEQNSLGEHAVGKDWGCQSRMPREAHKNDLQMPQMVSNHQGSVPTSSVHR